MESSDFMNLVFHEIDIIDKEQIMIVRHSNFLEDRRKRLMDFIENSEMIDISVEARENLLKNISTMEIKVLRVSKTVKDKDTEGKPQKKCRYDDKGYCRNEDGCKYKHFGQICETFLKDAKCEARHRCQFRHPRICKYWKHSDEGCRRGEMCKYLHQTINRKVPNAEKSVPENVDTVEVSVPENVDIVEVTPSGNSKCSEKDNYSQKIEDLEVVILSKNSTINDLTKAVTNLEEENKHMKEKLEQLMIITGNMHKELKNLKSKSCQ